MGKLELVREMYQFNEWANGRILDCAAKVSEVDLRARPPGQYISIIADLAHLIGGQVTWLGRWKTGVTPADVLRFDEMDSLAEVQAEAETSHRELREYFGGLTDAEVEAKATYEMWINPSWPDDKKAMLAGKTQEWPRWQMFLHLANHGSYTRGEIALLLTGLDASPGEIDFLHYQRTR
jgi:uncharacterized damage-inducible protein DinB